MIEGRPIAVPIFQDELLRWVASVESDPAPARRLGWMLMRFGVATALIATCFSIALMYVGFIAALSGSMLARAPVHRCPAVIPGVVFTLLQLFALCAFHIADSSAAPLVLGGMMWTWMLYPIAVVAFSSQMLRYALPIVAVLSLLSAADCVLQYLIGRDPDMRPFRIGTHGIKGFVTSGFLLMHLAQGYVMGMLALIFWFCGAGLGSFPKIAGRIGTGACMLLNGARSPALGLIFAVSCAAMAYLRKAPGKVAMAIMLVPLLFLASYYLLFNGRMHQMMAGEDARWVIWNTSVHMIIEHPWIGNGGPAGFPVKYNEVYPTVIRDVPNEYASKGGSPHAHNSFMSIAAESGLPAATAHLAFFVALLWAAYRQRHSMRSLPLALAAIAFDMGSGIFENFAGHTVSAFTFSLTIAIAFSARDPKASTSTQVVDGESVFPEMKTGQDSTAMMRLDGNLLISLPR